MIILKAHLNGTTTILICLTSVAPCDLARLTQTSISLSLVSTYSLTSYGVLWKSYLCSSPVSGDLTSSVGSMC